MGRESLRRVSWIEIPPTRARKRVGFSSLPEPPFGSFDGSRRRRGCVESFDRLRDEDSTVDVVIGVRESVKRWKPKES